MYTAPLIVFLVITCFLVMCYVAVNNPSELMIVVPQLEVGTYLLEVVTQFTTSGHLLKEPRIASFGKVLSVS